MCDFFSRLYAWEKKMEEDNIAVSLCIIIIASAILRIQFFLSFLIFARDHQLKKVDKKL